MKKPNYDTALCTLLIALAILKEKKIITDEEIENYMARKFEEAIKEFNERHLK